MPEAGRCCVDMLCLAYISRLTPKRRMICRLTPKSCLMYVSLRLAKTLVCCCPDQLNKRLAADSKIESVRRLLSSVRTNSTFVVASSQSQHVAFMTQCDSQPFFSSYAFAKSSVVSSNDGNNPFEYVVKIVGGQQ